MEKNQYTPSKVVVSIVVAIALVVVVASLVEDRGSIIWFYGIVIMAPLLFTLFFAVDRLEKQNAKQQTEIDDLKRELEEVKGKLKE